MTWYKADFHIHTSASMDTTDSVKQMIWEAIRKGLNIVAITDHNTIAALPEAVRITKDKKLLVVPGVEISAAEGHMLALGVTKRIEPLQSAKDTVAEIHRAGGLAVAAHPYDKRRGGLGDLVYCLELDAIEVVNGRSLGSKKAKKAAQVLNLPMLAGSDAHSRGEIGKTYTEVECDLTIKGVLSAIREKRLRLHGGFNMMSIPTMIRRRLP